MVRDIAIKNVTEKVTVCEVDDESVSLSKCVCGEEFETWKFVVSIYADETTECPKCSRRFVAAIKVEIYEIEE